MSELVTATMSAMGTFVSDYSDLWAIPLGVCAVGLVLTVVINALRNR